MNQHLQSILEIIQQDKNLSEEEKNAIIKSLKDADKEIDITNFKLDRTEKVKRTTAILLEETIEELEQKRKAVEAQNRELEIETSIERVRAQAMAMRQTTDLDKVNKELFNQLQWLKVEGLSGVSIYFIDEEGEVSVWDLSSFGNMGDPNSYAFKFSSKKYPILGELWLHFKNIRRDYFTLDYPLEKLKAAIPEFREIDTVIANAIEAAINSGNLKHQWNAFGRIANGVLGIDLMMPPSENTKTIVLKMAGAFNLAYKRFLDLQKAEAQAREAEIELALERVRARTMAMQHSNELAEVSSVLFQQIKELGFETWSCGFCIWSKDNLVEVWMGADSGGLLPAMYIPYKEEPTHHDVYKAHLRDIQSYNKIWEGKALEKHYAFLKTIPSVKEAIDMLESSGLSLPERQCYYVGFFKQGYLLLITKDPNAELKDLSNRFAKVFEQTYTRFLDLQKAEAQAKESQIEAALERVRSRTLAMQKSDELAETSAVLFKQLIGLGIAPNRLYIGIINEESDNIEFWITDEDGSKVSSMFSGDAHKNASIKKMYDGWAEHKKSIIIDMHGKELDEYFHYLGDELRVPFQNSLSQKRRIQYLSYFAKGFIGVASPDEQPEETLRLLERFAAVFNLTFTRFNDLKVAEAHALQSEKDLIEIKAARKKAEETLVELQSTQKQLIQSEKMASLGELTAGIAHEIQNPLNFVNNFSEVSAELIDEMKDELSKANYEDANAIADDLKQNLEKINHHGKRAGDIVKGMLQHSRKSEGKKEPTDINALADEYLRLAYHGLRAKDKNFNAILKTDFDNSIGKINIIPQEIGRVILNLITNAFYAVSEKQKQNLQGYEPTVMVSTNNTNNKIEISVKDNGSGIPQNIIDKIFQPFFTTKPTGQGTGLGLSLAYDIIKAHGGELKVETKEGQGSEFIIFLPAQP